MLKCHLLIQYYCGQSNWCDSPHEVHGGKQEEGQEHGSEQSVGVGGEELHVLLGGCDQEMDEYQGQVVCVAPR